MQAVSDQKMDARGISRGRFDHWVDVLTSILLFTYPSLLVLQKDVHLAFLVFLAGLGIFYSKTGWFSLSIGTKMVMLSVMLFLGLSFLSLFNVQDWKNCLWLLSRYEPFFLMPFLVVLFSTRKDVIDVLFYGMILGGIVCFGIAAYEVWGLGLERAGGAFRNANRFGSVAICFASFLTAAYFFLSLKGYVRILTGFSAFLCLWAGLLSGSRGAIFVFPVLVFAMIFLFIIKKKKSVTKLLMAIKPHQWLLVMCLLSFSVLFVMNNTFLKQHVQKAITQFEEYRAGKKDSEASVGQRLMMWGYAIQIWKRHPWIGTGIGDVERDMRELNDAAGHPMTHIYYHVHNLYLDVLASTGTVGFIGMVLGCFFSPFYAFWRNFITTVSNERTDYAAVCGIMTVIFFAINGVSEGWIYTRGVTFFVFLMAVFLSGLKDSGAAESTG